LARSSFVISDSGGIQEEAITFGKPLLLCRGTTERPEAISQGLAELIGNDFDRFENRIFSLMSHAVDSAENLDDIRLNLSNNPFGDGLASEKIIQII
jgi:UDP-N-acetylglucosamine 2-epimerase (non-hydrolysing)